jgi:hypothetical protein
MSAQQETRHYIGLYGETGRMHAVMGPDDPSSFKLPRHEPLPMADGTCMYPVSAEIAKAWELDDEDALPENLHDDPSVSSDASRWSPEMDVLVPLAELRRQLSNVRMDTAARRAVRSILEQMEDGQR